jgi:hypothetical protein
LTTSAHRRPKPASAPAAAAGPPSPDRPLFIVGPHRSGTTLVYHTLAQHPDVACFTDADRRMRDRPEVAHLLNLVGLKRKPHEAQKLWDLRRPRDDDVMDAADATPDVVAWYRQRVLRTMELRGRPRFLAKYPRHSLRLGWLDAVFPGCLFLHVTRDWRATVYSTATWKEKREKDGEGYFGVRIPGWRERAGVPPAEFAARIFRHVTKHLEAEAARFGSRFRVLAYEDFCAGAVREARAVAEWAGLRWTRELEKAASEPMESQNEKWKTGLDGALLDRIRATDPAFFARHER